MPEDPQAGHDGTGPAPNTETATGAGSPGDTPQAGQTVDSLPPWAQDLISSLRGENATHRKAKKEAELAAQAAEEARLAQEKEWQQLAEKRQARIQELEPLSEDVDRYKGAVTSLLEQRRAGLPDHIITLLDKLDPVEQLQWIAENADKLGRQAPGDINADRRSDEPPPPEVTEDEVKEFAARMGVDPRFVDKKLLRSAQKPAG